MSKTDLYEEEPPARLVDADRGVLTTIRNLWPYIWPSDRPDLKFRVFVATLALLVAKIVTVLVPYSFKWATDALVPAGGIAALATPTGIAVLLSVPLMLVVSYGVGRLVMNGFTQLRDALFASVGQYAVRQLAYKTFVHMHNLSLRFHLQRRTGGLSRIIERGVKGIETVVRFTILASIPTVIEFALMAGVIWWQFGWPYLAIMVVTVWLYSWFTVRASNWRIRIRREMNDSDTDANTKAIDSLLNYETVKYFGNEEWEARRFDGSQARYEKAAIDTWTSLAWLNMGQTVIFTVAMTICMGMSALAVMRGEQTIGDFVLINALLMQLSIPLNFLGMLYREIRQGLVDIEAMFDLMSVRPEVVDRPGAMPLEVSEGVIRFEDVHFHYDPERPILKGVSFEIPAGKRLAIVGPSGAGKSTISRLIFRFYEVSGGRITIDGRDIRDVTQKSLRAAIGMVPQDTVLFNDTIGYNIRYGHPGASHDDVREAARKAQIGAFIETLPHGYETQVGERGLKLSGGEKQRVAIARTILKAPPVLILDEATSALDSHTEHEIQGALDEVSANRTTLVIAHRLSTIINADEIIVLADGRIVERGTHGTLLGAGGLYASMWNRQREAAEAEERLRQVADSDIDGVVRRAPPLAPLKAPVPEPAE